jgi:DNA-binding MarR family transcriptional regulator
MAQTQTAQLHMPQYPRRARGATESPARRRKGAVTAVVATCNDHRMADAGEAKWSPTSIAERDTVVEAVLTASRAMVAIAIRSVAADRVDITLAQYRVLAVLAMDGPQRVASLSELLDVYSSTITRLSDRLVAKGLIERTAESTDRREVTLSLTRRGRAVVERVTARRHDAIAEIIDQIPPARRRALVLTLESFSAAAAQTPRQEWAHGWTSE